MQRKGCIYSELRYDNGREQLGCGSAGHFVRGVGFVMSERRRWVAEISIHNKLYRRRSVHLYVVQAWLNEMIAKYSDEPIHDAPLSEIKKRNKGLGKKDKYKRKLVYCTE